MIEDIKILAADIDMTLTAKGSGLPEVTRDAFEVLHRNGVKIGLATGRVIENREKTIGESWGLSFEFDFVVGMNGGQVYNRRDDSQWNCEMLTTDEMKAILTHMLPLIDEHNIMVNVEGNGNHSAMNIGEELIASARRHGFVFEDKTGDVEGFCYKPAYKFLFRSTPEYDQVIRDTFLSKFADDYQIIGTFPGTLEVMHKGIDKGKGVQVYAEQEGIPMENVIAFGDSENDNAMLACAGWSVCLVDGREGTKKYADELTDYSCGEGGVGRYLFDHYINPKGLK